MKKAESKSKLSRTKKASKENSSNVEATGSSVFDHEDDPIVIDIVKKQKKEARELSKRSRLESGSLRRGSMAKMADFQYSQSLSGAGPFFKKPSSRRKKDDASEHNPGDLSKELKRKIKKDKFRPEIFLKSQENTENYDSKEEDEQDEEFYPSRDCAPDIDELLRLPNRPEDGGKTKDEILDELDVEIARKQKKHDEDMAKIDMEIEEERNKRQKCQDRFKANVSLRNRLEKELTESKLRKMFKRNKSYLQHIFDGTIVSSRHQAFHKSVRTRQALFYTMITDPFTDDQLDCTLEEMSALWMRNKREQMDNNEYIWKVLLPECFIKFYMDMFGFEKAEAETRISETPLHVKDRPRIDPNSASEEESNTLTIIVVVNSPGHVVHYTIIY